MHAETHNPLDEHFLYYAVKREEVAYFCTAVESYPHIAKVSTVNAEGNILECLVPDGFLEEFQVLIYSLQKEGIDVREIPPPTVSSK